MFIYRSFRFLSGSLLALTMFGLGGASVARAQSEAVLERDDAAFDRLRSDSDRLVSGVDAHLQRTIDGTTAGSVSYMQFKPMPAHGSVVYGSGVSFVDESVDPFDLTFELEGGTEELLFFELQAGGWGGHMNVMQATVDWQTSYASGAGADLRRPVLPCDPNDATGGEETCRLAWGRGSYCRPDTPSPPVYPPNSCRDAYNNDDAPPPIGPPGEPDPNFISPGISQVHQPTMTYGMTPIGGPGTLDVGQIGYVGVLVVEVPADAAGTYVFSLMLGPPTFMIVDGSEITIDEVRPGIVHIPSGRCCVPLTGECIPNGFQADCNALGGIFVLDGECTTGVCCTQSTGGPDCDGNGITDVCEIEPALDCNANDVLDQCDVSSATSADCNDNGQPDECDLGSGSSVDCNSDGIPDECQPAEDCNSNSVTDICDIGSGTSEDCNFDLVPDECQPDEDCNTNGTSDICDIGAGTSLDCNENLVPDDCDITSGSSLDLNGDDVPDECCAPSAVVLESPEKSRYLSMSSIGTPGVRSGIAVVFGVNESFPGLVGQALWVGPPEEYPEEDSSDLTRTFTGAALTCEPYYQDWSAIDTLQVFGAEIVPNSQYAVMLVNEGCPTSFADNFSLPTQIDTGAFGDLVEPFFPIGLPQPNFMDISASVAKFLSNAGAPIKASAQLLPSVVRPVTKISFRDINATVQSFLGGDYIDIVLDAQVCDCPSAVICGATACANDADCGDGFCVSGFCTDACKRCSP